jgi:hypothetical protein
LGAIKSDLGLIFAGVFGMLLLFPILRVLKGDKYGFEVFGVQRNSRVDSKKTIALILLITIVFVNLYVFKTSLALFFSLLLNWKLISILIPDFGSRLWQRGANLILQSSFWFILVYVFENNFKVSSQISLFILWTMIVCFAIFQWRLLGTESYSWKCSFEEGKSRMFCAEFRPSEYFNCLAFCKHGFEIYPYTTTSSGFYNQIILLLQEIERKCRKNKKETRDFLIREWDFISNYILYLPHLSKINPNFVYEVLVDIEYKYENLTLEQSLLLNMIRKGLSDVVS